MLQISSGDTNKRGGHNAKPSETRRRFLEAYEKTFGNIDKSCKYAGISRQTYYRWMKSVSAVNIEFQRRVAEVRPVDLFLDLAETTLMKLIEEGNVKAAIYALRTKGRSRGWGTRCGPPCYERGAEEFDKKGRAFLNWLDDHPESTKDERLVWLKRFVLPPKSPS